ncbi:hypothetical protein C1645_831202 [Glomus cerebriforme]|uniref:Uncharacterized protein n=1 Tax=Glomus cerebriforme TaxID=658196 RepID=A0A397SFZ5_9GLOM|nr:hypothetical protein C1645_831202 [Glomus cerebriforme]
MRKKTDFCNNDYDNLKLWKVEIPAGNKNVEKLKSAAEKDIENIVKNLGGIKLDSMLDIDEYFDCDPPAKHRASHTEQYLSLQSPPSDKSTLGQYLEEYSCNHEYNEFGWTRAMDDVEPSDVFWKNEVGHSRKEIVDCENATFHASIFLKTLRKATYNFTGEHPTSQFMQIHSSQLHIHYHEFTVKDWDPSESEALVMLIPFNLSPSFINSPEQKFGIGLAEVQCCGSRVFPTLIRFPDKWDFCCSNGPCDGECCNCKGGCVKC